MADASNEPDSALQPKPMYLTVGTETAIMIYRVEGADNVTEKATTPIATWTFTSEHSHAWSSDGEKLAICNDGKTSVYVGENEFSCIREFRSGNCFRLGFSPKGNYIVGMTKRKDDNLIVMHIDSGKARALCTISLALDSEIFLPLQWTKSESCCFLITQAAVKIYDGDLVATSYKPLTELKITDKRCQALCVAPKASSNGDIIALFLGRDANRPGRLELYEVDVTPTCQRTTLLSQHSIQADEVKLSWNALGTALLVGGSTHIDATGQSYYGRSCLYYIRAQQGAEKQMLVSYDEGPVSDFQWSPTVDEFMVIYGKMPPLTKLYDGKTGNAIISFGERKRNSIAYNRFGRFIMIAGFGNLSGEVDIWDRKQKRILASIAAPFTVVYQWSPCGRLLMCATTTPRRRVDNGFKLYSYNGELKLAVKHDVVYTASWRIRSSERFLDRPPSLEKIRNAVKEVDTLSHYVPPSLRTMTLTSNAQPPKETVVRAVSLRAVSLKATPKQPSVPGFSPVKSAKRNLARRPKAREA